MKILVFLLKFQLYFQGSNLQQASIGPGNGLALNRQLPIIRMNNV